MLLMFKLPGHMTQFPLFLDLAIVYIPMFGFHYFSTRAEFEADREAVLHTGDPESAIRALANLYQSRTVLVRGNKLVKLFQIRPSLTICALAIVQVGGLPKDRVSKILKDAGSLPAVLDTAAEVHS